MPLPDMPPKKKTTGQNKSTGPTASPAMDTMEPPSTARKSFATSSKMKGKAKGKQPANSVLRASQSHANTPAFVGPPPPPSHPFQMPYTPAHVASPANEVPVNQIPLHDYDAEADLDFSYPEDMDERPHVTQHSSYQEGSLNSESQAALTFTLESQPMSDLSSSQQQDI